MTFTPTPKETNAVAVRHDSGRIDAVRRRFEIAHERRSSWEGHWQDCYDFALPQRDGAVSEKTPGGRKTDRLFDGTAPDAVEQLAASLLAELTPPWARWFGLGPGADVNEDARTEISSELERATTVLKTHFDRSNFAVEMHQCYLDLVTIGTASLLFEETQPGEASAFRFSAQPIKDVVMEEGANGRLDRTYRKSRFTIDQFRSRFPGAALPTDAESRSREDSDYRIEVIEAVEPSGAVYAYTAVLAGDGTDASLVAEGRFQTSPFINFRWLKAPGEAYGRSPVMKALPDIKTANKVVELVLKNASIAVTGIWQADDDGVLNPATIKLRPGTIIPKAVGSAGLTPLESPGQFDVSELVLDSLRGRIRTALLADKLGQPQGVGRMTATEVLERSAEMARVLGATYGRLQSELMTPLIVRALAILIRRGEIAPLRIDGKQVELTYRSPLALRQAQADTRATMLWLEAIANLGPDAMGVVDAAAAARWLGKAFAVPSDMIRAEESAAADMIRAEESAAADMIHAEESAVVGARNADIPTGVPGLADVLAAAGGEIGDA